MIKYQREFLRPDGSILVCESDGVNRTSYIKGKKPILPPEKRKEKPKNVVKQAPTNVHPTFMDCINFLGATTQTTEHKCGGCPGGQVTTVCECDLYELCLPMAWAPTPDSSIRRCVDCKSYKKSPA